MSPVCGIFIEQPRLQQVRFICVVLKLCSLLKISYIHYFNKLYFLSEVYAYEKQLIFGYIVIFYNEQILNKFPHKWIHPNNNEITLCFRQVLGIKTAGQSLKKNLLRIVKIINCDTFSLALHKSVFKFYVTNIEVKDDKIGNGIKL